MNRNGNDKAEAEDRNSKVVEWIGHLRRRSSIFESRIAGFLSRVPWRLLALAGCLLLGFAWWRERDARLHRGFELQQLKAETAQRVTELEARADAALRAANEENARLVRQLEARRRRLEVEAEALRRRLTALQAQERVRVGQVHALPPNLLAEHIASRLGLDAREDQDSGPGARASGPEKGSQGVAPAGESGQTKGTLDRSGHPPVPSSGARPPETTLTLTLPAMRQVETAFVELDACREQGEVKDQQLANCREQAAASADMVSRMNDSLQQLNEAVRAKDEIAARREAQHRAELKVARGSRWGRMRKALTYVAVGVVIGVVAR